VFELTLEFELMLVSELEFELMFVFESVLVLVLDKNPKLTITSHPHLQNQSN